MTPTEFAQAHKLFYILVHVGNIGMQKIYRVYLINAVAPLEKCLLVLEGFKPAARPESADMPPVWVVWNEILGYEQDLAQYLEGEPYDDEWAMGCRAHASQFLGWLGREAHEELINDVDSEV